MRKLNFTLAIMCFAKTNVKYLLETLEPQAVDSFFYWNF
jgi:hypothetical protein